MAPRPQGWRVEPIPSRPPYEDDDGNVCISVWLSRNGEHVADTTMRLRPSEADLLRDKIGDTLEHRRSVLAQVIGMHDHWVAPGVALVQKDESPDGWGRP